MKNKKLYIAYGSNINLEQMPSFKGCGSIGG